MDNSLPFLDVLVKRHSNTGQLTTSVYRKKTHTDQYLNFQSHHPVQHKLGVVRTLMDRKEVLISQNEDKITEDEHIKSALKSCCYPNWVYDQVDHQKLKKSQTVTKSNVNKSSQEKCRGRVTIPYIKGVSEKLSRILKGFNVASTFKPHVKLRDLLVHPKDSLTPLEKSGVVYKVPCSNCDHSYIGETGRTLGIRIKEHSDEVNKITSSRRFTRMSASEATDIRHKSAITDHAVQNNHVINFDNVTVINKEDNRRWRAIKESIEIRINKDSMNRDQGNHVLGHAYDDILKKSYKGNR